MTALAYEVIPVTDDTQTSVPVSDLDEFLWQTWKTMELPEGYRAEIIEGSIEVSPTGRRRHMVLINRLRRALDAHLEGDEYAVWHDGNVIHRRKCWIPDLFVAPADPEENPDEQGLGVDASGVAVIFEVVSPGHQNTARDRDRKRREYARAGIPLYVLVDDHDGDGTVVVLTAPNPGKATYADEHRVPYGTDAIIPDGPAKGFAIGEEITRA
ncbi:Uma2 family endonuclease [Streptomyces sp. NPDC059255]|uniref:Uma2 family endonuclease n=1 Tax=Streptomyces sp. NPDC059255 TaxID=3346793 RepID=UPI00367E65C0